jgi:hypothetical protein
LELSRVVVLKIAVGPEELGEKFSGVAIDSAEDKWPWVKFKNQHKLGPDLAGNASTFTTDILSRPDLECQCARERNSFVVAIPCNTLSTRS